MEESLIKPAGETSWYENEQPVQEFLKGYRKSATEKEELQSKEPSWLNIMKKAKK